MDGVSTDRISIGNNQAEKGINKKHNKKRKSAFTWLAIIFLVYLLWIYRGCEREWKMA
jgi:hypothetical protein